MRLLSICAFGVGIALIGMAFSFHLCCPCSWSGDKPCLIVEDPERVCRIESLRTPSPVGFRVLNRSRHAIRVVGLEEC